MTIIPGRKFSFGPITVDINLSDASIWLHNCFGAKFIHFRVYGATGTSTGLTVAPYGSPDGVNDANGSSALLQVLEGGGTCTGEHRSPTGYIGQITANDQAAYGCIPYNWVHVWVQSITGPSLTTRFDFWPIFDSSHPNIPTGVDY